MPLYSKSVLLIDDDPADRTLFARELRKLGFEVIETASPDAALAAIVGGNVGCVVTDQTMPVSGHELVSIARNVRSDIGVVFLSGAPTPNQPIPPGSLFICKDDKPALSKAVSDCMIRWRTEVTH